MDNRKITVGLFLIFLGVFIGMVNLNMVSGLPFLSIISAGFLFFYVLTGGWNNRASIGFLIPGLIIGSISIVEFIDDNRLLSGANDGFFFLLLLGASFLLLMPIHTMRFKNIPWGEKYWPIFPGTIISMVGILGLSFGEDKRVWGLINPIILITIGAYILAKPYLKGRQRNNSVTSIEEDSKDRID